MLVVGNEVCRSYSGYGGRVDVLKNVSFAVAEGEFVAVVGPSGSGKSTLMNLVGLLDRPTSGDLVVAGHRVAGLSGTEMARLRASTLGFVFQSYNLLPRMGALENVAMPLCYARVGWRSRRAMAERALAKVGLGAKADRRPRQLSGGEQQRVAIARALVLEPAILLADEPTGALDVATGQEVLALFEALHRAGHTIILVTHDMAVAARAQRVIRLGDGRVVDEVGYWP